MHIEKLLHQNKILVTFGYLLLGFCLDISKKLCYDIRGNEFRKHKPK